MGQLFSVLLPLTCRWPMLPNWLGIALAILTAAAPHFAELRQPPVPPSPQAPRLSPLVTAEGKPFPDRSAWRKARKALKAEWQEILGPFPHSVPLNPVELSREEQPDHTRLRLRYAVDAETQTEAYLLLPKGFKGRRPGMVVLHQTTNNHLEEPVGLQGRESMHLALHLVRRGYVCIAPRNYLWSRPGLGYQQVTDELLRNGAGFRWKTGLARMTWDAIRATDLLATRPEVDAKRLGSIGHSLGGKEVLYHAAFDERVRAAVSCEGGAGLSFSNWDADWYLGKQISSPGFRRDQHEVIALIAPRAFLLIGGGSADGAQSWPYVEGTLPVWRLFGAEERLGLLRHDQGHDFPAPGPVREQVYGWLDHWLSH